VSVVCGQIEFSATGQSFVERSLTVCGVSECDQSKSLRMPRPTAVVEL